MIEMLSYILTLKYFLCKKNCTCGKEDKYFFLIPRFATGIVTKSEYTGFK